jgi:hypothetical protein
MVITNPEYTLSSLMEFIPACHPVCVTLGGLKRFKGFCCSSSSTCKPEIP